MLRHRLPNTLATVSTVALIVVLGLVIGGGAMFRGLTELANSAYSSQNDETSEGITEPTSSSVSGSSDSLVSWESLGRTGRDFVASATTTAELREFHGA